MGLSFLNKKIWHPGSFAGMEKTWVTEQKYREVEIRAIEKAKKIKEEKVLHLLMIQKKIIKGHTQLILYSNLLRIILSKNLQLITMALALCYLFLIF